METEKDKDGGKYMERERGFRSDWVLQKRGKMMDFADRERYRKRSRDGFLFQPCSSSSLF